MAAIISLMWRSAHGSSRAATAPKGRPRTSASASERCAVSPASASPIAASRWNSSQSEVTSVRIRSRPSVEAKAIRYGSPAGVRPSQVLVREIICRQVCGFERRPGHSAPWSSLGRAPGCSRTKAAVSASRPIRVDSALPSAFSTRTSPRRRMRGTPLLAEPSPTAEVSSPTGESGNRSTGRSRRSITSSATERAEGSSAPLVSAGSGSQRLACPTSTGCRGSGRLAGWAGTGFRRPESGSSLGSRRSAPRNASTTSSVADRLRF